LVTNNDSLRHGEIFVQQTELSIVIRPREPSKKRKFAMGENEQSGPWNETRPIRVSKAKGIGKFSEAMKIENEEQRNMWLEDKKH
jgi:hypothetical protein